MLPLVSICIATVCNIQDINVYLKIVRKNVSSVFIPMTVLEVWLCFPNSTEVVTIPFLFAIIYFFYHFVQSGGSLFLSILKVTEC